MRYIPYRRIKFGGIMHLERLLPFPGEVIVQPGQVVQANDVIAQSHLAEYKAINIAVELDEAPAVIDQYLRVKPGDNIEAKEVLASRRLFWPVLRRLCRSPVKGKLLAIRAGWALLEIPYGQFDLRAFIDGVVASIIPGRGAIIKGEALQIDGAVAFGGEACGALKLLGKSPNDLITPEMINVGHYGSIIIGGGIGTEGLERAGKIKVAGVIVGGLPVSLREECGNLKFPLILTEGYGLLPISDTLFQVFKESEGKKVAVLNTRSSTHRHPRLMIAISARTPMTAPSPDVALDEPVIIIRGEARGREGFISAIPNEERALGNGLNVRGAEINIGGQIQFHPWENILRLV